MLPFAVDTVFLVNKYTWESKKKYAISRISHGLITTGGSTNISYILDVQPIDLIMPFYPQMYR